MNLESFGFPVDKYPERDAAMSSAVYGPIVESPDASVVDQNPEIVQEEHDGTIKGGAEVHAVEKQVRARGDPLESLSGQVPKPCVEAPNVTKNDFWKYAPC